MPTKSAIIIRMTELDYCIVCGKPVALNTDPSVCSEDCLEMYEYEVAFNKFCNEEWLRHCLTLDSEGGEA